MRFAACLALLWAASPSLLRAGDDASGPIAYGANIGGHFRSYELSDKDRSWADELARRLNYDGKIGFFVRTDISLKVDGLKQLGSVYRRVDSPGVFYVVPGDSMLKIGQPHPFNPGVGGFDLFAPPSKNFFICFSCAAEEGVPVLNSSPVVAGEVTWHTYGTRRRGI
jgi:hypothetical protein